MQLTYPPAIPRLTLLLALSVMPAGVAYAADAEPCWAEAASRYTLPVDLLKAVAQVESSNRARVIARNTNGSLDIGFMQINDWWLPKLAQHGIGKNALLDACTNLHVGAWILKQGIDRYGYNWQGIGAYGAGTSPKKDNTRRLYANKVFRALAQQRGHAGAIDVARVQPAPAVPASGRRQQPSTAVAPASAPDEQIVWSVFD